jgi:hypothetical protein
MAEPLTGILRPAGYKAENRGSIGFCRVFRGPEFVESRISVNNN